MIYRFLPLLCLMLLPIADVSGQYHRIDRHARRAPEALSKDLPALAEYLAQAARTETELARAIYTWTVRFMSYDEGKEGHSNSSVREILQRRRGVCEDYARLYQAICRYAGLKCVKVDGYAKPDLESTVFAQKPDHSWNAVYTDGRWRLVDATWGEGKDAFSAQYGVDYFATEPALFLLTHLPAQPMWQLLPAPIESKQFRWPAEQLRQYLAQTDSTYAYTDSIAHYLALASEEQRLQKARAGYRYYPTAENQQQYAHALMDYAAYLDEQSEQNPLPDSLNRMLAQQRTAIRYGKKAEQWTELHDWQKQLLAQLHVNHAIALYRATEPEDTKRLAKALRFAEEGHRRLEKLPEGDFYRNYALPQSQQLLESLRYLLDK